MIERKFSEEEGHFLNEEQDVNTISKRPVFLLVLVILSSINIGISSIGALSGMLGAKPDKAMIKSAKLDFANMREQLDKANAADFIYIIDQMESVTDNMFKYFQAYNSVQFLVLVLGLAGASVLLFWLSGFFIWWQVRSQTVSGWWRLGRTFPYEIPWRECRCRFN